MSAAVRHALALLLPLLLAGCASEQPDRALVGWRGELRKEFSAADKNGDEVLSREELAAAPPRLASLSPHFDDMDLDRNGRVNRAEVENYAEWRGIANTPPPDRFAR